MLTIGEFSNICRVSTKTLRYYEEIGLLLPQTINPENGYRYYNIDQLETMLFINRLKNYNFSLDEIKEILTSNNKEEVLYSALIKKKVETKEQLQRAEQTIIQMENDLNALKEGKSIMSYLDKIDIQLVEVSSMNLLFIRKKVHEFEFEETYKNCFGALFQKIKQNGLTILAPPMVLFHDSEFTSFGLDTEFAIPIEEIITETREFHPGLCLKTVLHGSYSNLPSVYTRQREWTEKEGYENTGPLYEIYISDPTYHFDENDLVTEIYYPVKKKSLK